MPCMKFAAAFFAGEVETGTEPDGLAYAADK